MGIIGETTRIIPRVQCHKCQYIWDYYGDKRHSTCPECKAMVTFYPLRGFQRQ